MSSQDLKTHRERQERASRGRRTKTDTRRPAAPELRRRRVDTVSAPPTFFSRLLSALRRVPWWSLFFWAAFAALIAVQVVLIRNGVQRQQLREQEARELQAEHDALEQHIQELEDAAPVSFEIRYLIPNQDDIVEHVPYGAPIIVHDPVELDGYTFLYWENADGEPETRSTFPLFEDTVLTARYALKFETKEHITYLSADESGVVDVDAPVTIREFVKILYKLLNIDLVGTGTFLDVGEKDSCYKAAATLKDLGVLKGNELYPNEHLRFLELLQYLECFYPAAAGSFEFPGLDVDSEAYSVYSTAAAYGWIDNETEMEPSSVVTRGLLAHIVNRVLGRATAHPDEDAVGLILDVGPMHPYYTDIAEAVIPHSYTLRDSVEIWTGSIPLPMHDPGMFFAGVRLHCIDEDGHPIRSTTVGGRTYNANGELTSGDAELDRKLWEILKEKVDPEVMKPEEMLYELYDYICRTFSPAEDTLYPIGAEGWAVKEAKRILENGEASCYGYAALFYELSYMIGYQPKLISGSIFGTQTQFESEDGIRVEAHAGHKPYAWVEIKFDGIWFIFDPAGESKVDSYRMYYKRYDPVRWQRGYRSDVF